MGNEYFVGTEDHNTEDHNTEDHNTEDHSTGYYNAGHFNKGDCNIGNHNTGDWNAGHWNTGHWNAGHWNTGEYNTGNSNTGNCNAGHLNSGQWNIGNYNTGNWNAGNHNTGDWNKTNYSSGVLCTDDSECLIFDKPSGMTLTQWRRTEAAEIMSRINCKTTKWVQKSDMTKEEKKSHPEYVCLGGYLKKVNSGYEFSAWWESLSEHEKDVIKAIPNFDRSKWRKITGIEVD